MIERKMERETEDDNTKYTGAHATARTSSATRYAKVVTHAQ